MYLDSTHAEIVWDLQISSLLREALRISERFPFLDVEVSTEERRLTARARDPLGYQAQLLECGFTPNEADQLYKEALFFIDLAANDVKLETISRLVLATSPDPPELPKRLHFPAISVADPELNAKARKDGILAINHGLLDASISISSSALLLLEFFRIPNIRERKNAIYNTIYKATVGVGDRLTSVATQVVTSLNALVDEVNLLRKDQGLSAWPEYVQQTNELLLFFLVAHEFGHVMLQHHDGKSPYMRNSDRDRTDLTREAEADLYAMGAVANLLNGRGISLEMAKRTCTVLATAVYFLILAQQKPRSLNEIKIRKFAGHPDAFTRFLLMTETIFGDDIAGRKDAQSVFAIVSDFHCFAVNSHLIEMP